MENGSKKDNLINDVNSTINIVKNIKSIYNIKRILSLLSAKKKLSLIINNKALQKKLNINIENYKTLSGKYKVTENDGNTRIYKINSTLLLFEGKYVNGKKNGLGKEYHINGKLKFEGEYLN